MMIAAAIVAFLCATGWQPPDPRHRFLRSLMGAYLLGALLDGIMAVRDTAVGRKAIGPFVALVVVALAAGVVQARRYDFRATAVRYAGYARGCEAAAAAGEQKGVIEVVRGCLGYRLTDPGRVRSEVHYRRGLAAHYTTLGRKYERAADRPWLAVAPDPPPPPEPPVAYDEGAGP